MPTKIYKLDKVKELDPGKSGQWHWNNAAEVNAVWTANAVPFNTTDYYTQSQDTQLEVTRLWRRYKVTDNSLGQIADDKIETEIHYEVKNVGTQKAKFMVYLCATW